MATFTWPEQGRGRLPLALILAVFGLFLLSFLAAQEFDLEENGVTETEYLELLEADAASNPPGPDFDCPIKLTRSQWDELQAQYDRTPAVGDALVSGEHYNLIALLNRWSLFPHSREAALELAGLLLTYCLEE